MGSICNLIGLKLKNIEEEQEKYRKMTKKEIKLID